MLDMKKTAEGTHVGFDGDFTIFEVGQVFDELKPALLENQDLFFDLSKVASIDTSVIQSFMFIKNNLKTRGNTLYLVNHSQPVVDLMERLGLLNWFNDPVIISPGE